ncbi:hypothetical protein HORIV_70630 [Vreelandella olivaria]|uniref:Acyl-CoA dehydrogenase C-terminal domain-containing protein n=1 Tax=Vreelandella olivaria TaxID=390919 RepID=A0ABM7GU76_9GAMM|nr:hypothetical protein HORIV_70630 [Halomonas olivaria]
MGANQSPAPPTWGEREYAQIALGKAEAKVRAARAFFYESTDAAWASIQAGGEPSREQINLLRLSTTHLTHECAESIRSVYQISGMTGADNGHPCRESCATRSCAPNTPLWARSPGRTPAPYSSATILYRATYSRP